MLLKNIFQKNNRTLLSELVRTDFKLRYQGSILGYLWSLLRPLFLFCIMYVVFVKVFPLGRGIPHFPVYLLFGLVLWAFFVETTSQGLQSIVARGDLIRKISIPRSTIVLSSSISALVNLGFNLVIVLLFAVINRVEFGPQILLLPFIILQLYAFALSFAFLLSTLNVSFRDVGYIWEVLLQGLFYATPIIYQVSQFATINVQKVLFLSPLATIIQDARRVFVTDEAVTIADVYGSPWPRIAQIIFVALLLTFSYWLFNSRSRYFAENI